MKVVVLVLLTALIAPTPSSRPDLVVDCQNNGPADNIAFRDAMEAASNGSTIEVRGTCQLSQIFVIDKSVVLTGEEIDDDGDGAVNEDWDDGIDNDGDGTVDEDGWDAVFDGGRVNVSASTRNLAIRGLEFRDTVVSVLAEASNAKMTRNWFRRGTLDVSASSSRLLLKSNMWTNTRRGSIYQLLRLSAGDGVEHSAPRIQGNLFDRVSVLIQGTDRAKIKGNEWRDRPGGLQRFHFEDGLAGRIQKNTFEVTFLNATGDLAGTKITGNSFAFGGENRSILIQGGANGVSASKNQVDDAENWDYYLGPTSHDNTVKLLPGQTVWDGGDNMITGG